MNMTLLTKPWARRGNSRSEDDEPKPTEQPPPPSYFDSESGLPESADFAIDEKPKEQCDPEWVEGDCEIVSADGVYFRVPSYYLLGAGQGFRDALSQAGGSKDDGACGLRLSEECETAPVLREFLKLVVHGEITLLTMRRGATYGAEWGGAVRLVLFLRRWGCAVPLRSYFGLVGEAVHAPGADPAGGFDPLAGFLLGAVADEPAVCAGALRNRRWRVAGLTTPDGETSVSGWDPRHFSFAAVNLLPRDYLWALARAFGEVGTGAALPTRFAEYLSAAQSKPATERERPAGLKL